MNDSLLHLNDSPSLVIALVVGTLLSVIAGAWIAMDAKANRVPISGDRYNLNTGAAAWFLSCVILLVATLPYYLHRRARVRMLRNAQAAAVRPFPDDIDSKLRGFAKLRDDGLITNADYEAKKRLLLGLDTQTAVSIRDQPQPINSSITPSATTSSPSRGVATVGAFLIFAALGLSFWFMWDQSASLSGPPAHTAQLPSKAEWMRRAATVGTSFLLQNGKILAPRDALYRAVGEPNSSQTMGNETYLYWDCSDGTIQLSVSTGHLTVNEVSGDVNTY